MRSRGSVARAAVRRARAGAVLASAVLASALLVLAAAARAQEPATVGPAGCDRARGERVFTKCAICHSRDAATPSPAGPHLQGVVGRKSGTLEQFRFSRGLRDFGQAWTVELLDRYLADPAGVVPGTAMAFSGLKDARDRAAVICLLASAR